MKKSSGEFFLNCKECILENPRAFYGSFSLGPFGNSQSLTIANAFRRTLLTEIGNIAITNVQIDGVFHEYSTIEGVRESVLDILLNFKQIVLKTSKPLKKPIYGYLNVRGPGIVRISDLKLPPTLQYVDPDQYIATLNENGKLCLKVVVSDFSSIPSIFQKERTRENPFQLEAASSFPSPGHSPFGEGKGEAEVEGDQKKEIGPLRRSESDSGAGNPDQLNTPFLYVDATFNPILKVNYSIENLEGLQKSLRNQVIHIELWTNGSIHPRNAINLSITFLKNMFDKFHDMEKVSSKISKEFFESDETLLKILKSFEYGFHQYGSIEAKKSSTFHPLLQFPESQQKNKSRNKISLDSSIHILNLPYRISECLVRNNFLTLGDLVKFRKKEFSNFSGIGNFSLLLIQKKLKKLGFDFKN